LFFTNQEPDIRDPFQKREEEEEENLSRTLLALSFDDGQNLEIPGRPIASKGVGPLTNGDDQDEWNRSRRATRYLAIGDGLEGLNSFQVNWIRSIDLTRRRCQCQ
jgi:hypothetical protein